MPSVPFPLAQYCASILPQLNYTGFSVRPPTSANSSPSHVKRNAATPSLLKSIIQIPLQDFVARVTSYVTSMPAVDMSARQDLPKPLKGSQLTLQINPPKSKDPARNIHPTKSLLQVSLASHVGDVIRLSLLPTTSYLLRAIYKNRPENPQSTELSPDAFSWHSMKNYYHDPELRVDGGHGVRIAPSLQGCIWGPNAPTEPPPKDSKGKGKVKEESPPVSLYPQASPKMFLAVCPRWILTSQDFKALISPRTLSASISPTKPFGPTKSEVADNVLAQLTDQCVRESIHHVVITSHDLWTFGAFSSDFSELHLTPPIPLTSAPPEHAPLPVTRKVRSRRHPCPDDSDHLAQDGFANAPVSVLQALLYMMESTLRISEAGVMEGAPATSNQEDTQISHNEPGPSRLSRQGDSLSSAGQSSSQSLRKRKRYGTSATSLSHNMSLDIFDTVSILSTYGGSEDDRMFNHGRLKRRRTSGSSLSDTEAQPVSIHARQMTSSPPPYSPPDSSRSPSPNADANIPMQSPLPTPTSSIAGSQVHYLKPSPSSMSSSIARSVPATVGHFRGFGPIGRDKYIQIAENLRHQRKRASLKGKKKQTDLDKVEESDEGEVEDLLQVDVDLDENGSGRAALIVSRAR